MSWSPLTIPPDITSAFASAQNAHSELLDSSEAWASYLKSYLATMASMVTTPNVAVSWGSIQGSVPVTWGAAYSAPGAVTVPTVTDPMSATMTAFSYTDSTYTPDMKTTEAAVITGTFTAGGLMSAQAWADLYTDAADDLTALYTGDVLQAGNTCGMFGELPSEALLARVAVATAKHRQGLQKVRIGLAGERAKANREDLTKMVDAAQKHDATYGELANKTQERLLQAAGVRASESRAFFGASWQAAEVKYRAMLAGTQANAAAAATQIESEKTRVSLDNMILQLAIENAKLNQGKGIADANLYMQRLSFIDKLNADLLTTVAQLSAHTMGAYLSAGSINYGASAGLSHGTSNSWGYAEKA